MVSKIVAGGVSVCARRAEKVEPAQSDVQASLLTVSSRRPFRHNILSSSIAFREFTMQ
jgi:hypothetical protein